MAAQDDADEWAGKVIGALLGRDKPQQEAFFRDAPCGAEMERALRDTLHYYEGAPK